MTGPGWFLWLRVVLIVGLTGYLGYRLWRNAQMTDFRIGRFTRKGSTSVRRTRHDEEREAMRGLDKKSRMRLEGAEELARRREAERRHDKTKSKTKDAELTEEEKVAEIASKHASHFDFEVEDELATAPPSEVSDVREEPSVVDAVQDPDSVSYWDGPPSATASHPAGKAPRQERRRSAREWQESDYRPDMSELGPERRDTLGAPKHVGTRKLRLRLRNLDADRLEIVANGQPVVEFNGEKEQEVLVPAGALVIEVMQLGGEGYCRGRMDTGDAKLISINIADSQLMNCMADGGLWPMDIEARKSSSAARPRAGALAGFQPGRDRPVPPWEKKGWDISTGWDLSQGQDRVGLRIRSLDGEWADIYVNGALLARIRNQEEAEAFVPQGTHILEVREYLADEPYSRAELTTGDTPEILIDVEQDQPIRSFNHDSFKLLDL